MFLTKSELEHAHHIIQALFDAQLKVIQNPLTVSNFQGDAILCYVSETDVDQSDKLLQQILGLYQAFIDQMRAMQVNPPCGCTACANINMLELKIFVHYGNYMIKQVGDRQELMGADVILAHRMMKNSVKEETGSSSYLLMSQQAYQKFKDSSIRLEVSPHSETYENLGKVEMYVSQLPH